MSEAALASERAPRGKHQPPSGDARGKGNGNHVDERRETSCDLQVDLAIFLFVFLFVSDRDAMQLIEKRFWKGSVPDQASSGS